MNGLQALVWCLNNRGIPANIKEGLKQAYEVFDNLIEIGKDVDQVLNKTTNTTTKNN